MLDHKIKRSYVISGWGHKYLAKITGRSTVVMEKLLIKLLLKLNLTCILVYQGEAQLMTACNTTGYQPEPSLYQRVCCLINNLGQSFAFKGNGTRQYIFCPNELVNSCPSGIQMWSILVIIIMLCNRHERLYELVPERLYY